MFFPKGFFDKPFGFLRVSSLLFKPLQVKEFLYGQVQTFDITMFTVLALEFVSLQTSF